MFRLFTINSYLRPRTDFSLSPRRNAIAFVGLAAATIGTSLAVLSKPVHLDAPQDNAVSDVVKDPATGIEFPKTLKVPSRFPLPTYTLVGVGVRKVSFLGINVYSVGFYADLDSVPPISRDATFDEKIRNVVENSSCVLRIVPTRSTSYSHLRDGFMRSIQARMVLQKSRGLLTEEQENRIASPLLKFKSLFPSTTLSKHTPLDILLPPTAKVDGKVSQERGLMVRDLGVISNTWLAEEFFLTYFEGKGISPPLKQTVEERLENIGK
ncbi:hypothetical protein M422DRAFT_227207 [Sphaerobolus stellatus SS14]|uniref:Chalcone isomerase domain-containing protein n=1 Tax=Sphaerobolus stellatus (strain SS14) TaxID=990650 RepID=A0A0C9W1X0_SPHS4|nr:hypothetical protein M422DRAFT_227207 [Sphaerobolus stellatus SS14]